MGLALTKQFIVVVSSRPRMSTAVDGLTSKATSAYIHEVVVLSKGKHIITHAACIWHILRLRLTDRLTLGYTISFYL